MILSMFIPRGDIPAHSSIGIKSASAGDYAREVLVPRRCAPAHRASNALKRSNEQNSWSLSEYEHSRGLLAARPLRDRGARIRKWWYHAENTRIRAVALVLLFDAA